MISVPGKGLKEISKRMAARTSMFINNYIYSSVCAKNSSNDALQRPVQATNMDAWHQTDVIGWMRNASDVRLTVSSVLVLTGDSGSDRELYSLHLAIVLCVSTTVLVLLVPIVVTISGTVILHLFLMRSFARLIGARPIIWNANSIPCISQLKFSQSPNSSKEAFCSSPAVLPSFFNSASSSSLVFTRVWRVSLILRPRLVACTRPFFPYLSSPLSSDVLRFSFISPNQYTESSTRKYSKFLRKTPVSP